MTKILLCDRVCFVLEHDENFRKRFSTARLPQGISRGDHGSAEEGHYSQALVEPLSFPSVRLGYAVAAQDNDIAGRGKKHLGPLYNSRQQTASTTLALPRNVSLAA
ncbi:hypothetical protein V1477_010237 [Vespula maculifrons]|uniref:Uncharacterized protein n=1 Tax=Vespula maculifrons TaxID=7453 RepID=A0ABD2C7Y8_VESMC